MKNFDFKIIVLGIIALLAISLTSCSTEEIVEPETTCRNFDIEQVGYHQIKLYIHSTNPSVEVCRESIVDGKSYGWDCRTILANFYNCYGIQATEGIDQLNISVDGCVKAAW